MYTLKNDIVSYTVNDQGGIVSIRNLRSGREYCLGDGDSAGEIFRLIYRVEDFEERSIHAAEQKNPMIIVENGTMRLTYEQLMGPDGILPIRLTVFLVLDGERLTLTAEIENRSHVHVKEIQLSAMAGIYALGDDPKKDSLMLPMKLGQRVDAPTEADFSKVGGLGARPYDRPDYRYSAIDFTYPGYSCMQWYCLYNDRECLYVGSHDTAHHIICQHVERRVSDRTLRLGVCHYPFLEQNETWVTPLIVYAFLEGDWHSGSRFYRRFMTEEYGWKAPTKPDWVKQFQGWLRVIFRTQSGEYNYRFSDIPQMFDELQEAGLDTLFLLGWPHGGFGRLRPDYVLGVEEKKELERGIEYVHSRGGKVILFVSYHVVDRKSRWFTECGGEDVLVRDLWGNLAHYAETYAADGTYRMMLNNPYKQCCACSGSDKWHEKMLETSEFCMDLGADGILFDLGGTKPSFCTTEGHDHKKPNESRASKVKRWSALRDKIKAFGDRVIAEEHCIDIYTQYMDLVQPGPFTTKKDSTPEMFRYTFPEVVMTNRNMALSEVDMRKNCNFTYLYGMAFDLSIFRCAGKPSDIPNYTAYMKTLIALRKRYADYFFGGTFVDEDGFTAKNGVFRQKAYRTADGRLGLAVWNDSGALATEIYTNKETGNTQTVTLDAEQVTFVEL